MNYIKARWLLAVSWSLFSLLGCNSSDGIKTTEKDLTFTSPPPTVVFGDLSGDGLVDSKDVTLLLRHISGTALLASWQLAIADTNSDDEITTDDVTTLQSFIVGSIDKLPL